MFRTRLNEALKEAMRAKNPRAVSTLRLILAATKDRDIAARGRGITDGIDEEEILSMLQTMIKQRREAIALYEQGGRLELAEQEREEIGIIETFLPKQFDDAEVRNVVADRDRRYRRHQHQGHGQDHGRTAVPLCRPDGFRQGQRLREGSSGSGLNSGLRLPGA